MTTYFKIKIVLYKVIHHGSVRGTRHSERVKTHLALLEAQTMICIFIFGIRLVTETDIARPAYCSQPYLKQPGRKGYFCGPRRLRIGRRACGFAFDFYEKVATNFRTSVLFLLVS